MTKWLVSGAVLAIAAASPALAQASDDQKKTGEASTNLSEIVVTANKREERLQDVAAAISVIDGAVLEKAGEVQFSQYFDKVPGLAAVVGAAPGRLIVALRGISTGQSQTNAAVGFYIGEVPFGSSGGLGIGGTFASDPNTFDVQRVEVLKGPQGTLYGASTLGGLIKTVYNPAEIGETAARVVVDGNTVRYGGEGYSGNAMINLPIGEDLAIRSTFSYRRDAGFIDNVVPGNLRNNQNTQDAIGGRITALYAPDSPFSLELTAIYQEVDSNGLNEVDVDAVTLQPVVGDLKTQANNFQPEARLEYQIYSAKMDYDLGPATLTSVSSFGSYKMRQLTDETIQLPIGLIIPYETNNGLDNYTQELRLASNGGGSFEWLGGFFYTRQDNDWTIDSTALIPGTFAPTPLLVAQFRGTARYTEVAGFVNGTFKLTDKLSLNGGARLSENRQRFRYERAGALFAGADPNSEGRDKDAVWTYSAAVEFRPDAKTLLYVKTANGYRPGGPQVSSLPGLPESFGPDRTYNYEAGVKFDSIDRKLSLDANVFYIDWSDIQLLQTVTLTVEGATLRRSLISNAGGASSKGFDFSARYSPVPALSLGLTGGYTDAQLEDDAVGLGGAAGERIPYTPRFQIAATADYTIDLGGDRSLTFGASARHVGNRTTYFSGLPGGDPGGNINALMPSYEIVDLRAALALGKLEIAARITNLTDERAILSAVSKGVDPGTFAFTTAQAAVAQPRTFGLTISRDF
jgi:outer membrane receptor protein involved in Fe transport